MLSKLKVRTKLLAVLLVPMLALAVLTLVFVKDRFEHRDEATGNVELTRTSQALTSAASELGNERLLAAAFMGGDTETASAQLPAQKTRTDQALALALATLQDGHYVTSNSEPKRVFDRLSAEVERLGETRADIEDPKADAAGVLQGYDNVTGRLSEMLTLLGAATRGSIALDDATILVKANNSESSQIAYVALQLGTGDRIGADTRLTAATESRGYGAASSALRSTFINDLATSADRKILRTASIDPRYAASTAVFSKIDDGQAPADFDITLSEFVSLAQDRQAVTSAAEQQVLSRQDQVAARDAASAQLWARIAVALAVLGFVLTGLLAVVVARSISRPLLRLVGAAKSLNEETLPALVDSMARPDIPAPAVEPIEVSSDDEIGTLANALNELQQTAVDVANRQSDVLRRGISDIFVNLARRNQSLLDRQIEYIDRLEATEEDSEQLERLFRLDHLATRMRRNAESLLVLAGAEQTRRRTRDVPLRDVVRVAIGEVEDYRRIEISSLDDVLVLGSVAVDLAHLLSELMENGTQYSPPDTVVDVVGMHAQNGTYVVTISDSGVGMSDAQISQSNSLLARPPAVALNVGRALGFVVVAALASRHKVGVRLSRGLPAGTIAAVSLPSGAFRLVGGADTHPAEARREPIAAPREQRYGAPSSGGYSPVNPGVREPAVADYSTPAAPMSPAQSVSAAEDHRRLADLSPAAEAPSFAPPAVEPPGFQTAPFDPQGLAAPSFDAPAFEAPTSDAAAFQAPPFDAPAFEPPAFEAPAFEPAAFEPDTFESRPAEPFESPAVAPAAFNPPADDGGSGIIFGGEDLAFAPASDDPPAFDMAPMEILPGGEPAAPRNLDEAVPLGRAFEMGIYSLLDQNPTGESQPGTAMEAFDFDGSLPVEEPAPRVLPRREGPSAPFAEAPSGPSASAPTRSPEEVWTMLNRYRSARQRGRATAPPGDTAGEEFGLPEFDGGSHESNRGG